MAKHRYTINEIFAYTPDELDAYLATKDWASTTLADKRQATLMLLNVDDMLTRPASELVYSFYIKTASQNATTVEQFVNMVRVPQRLRDLATGVTVVNPPITKQQRRALLTAATAMSTYTGPFTREGIHKRFSTYAERIEDMVWDQVVRDPIIQTY